MAIAFDASSSGGPGPSSPVSWSHTCTGSDLVLIVAIAQFTGSAILTGVTYNGVSMTAVANKLLPGSGGRVSVYRLFSPATGANTITVSFSGGDINTYTGAISLTGVSSTGQVSSTGSASSSALSTSNTPSADNGWIIDAGYLLSSIGNTLTVGGSQTDRVNISAGNSLRFAMSTRGPVSPAASTAMDWTGTGTSPQWAQVTVSFAPYVAPGATNSGFLAFM